MGTHDREHFKFNYARRSRRYLVDSGELRISWRDPSGAMKVAQARAINVSEHGMALELPATETPTPVIWFQWDKYKIRGSGAVRHRCRVGRRVVVGLEFNASLELSEPLLSA